MKEFYTNFDECYSDLVNHINENGIMSTGNVRTKYADGTPARYKSVIGVQFRLRNTKNDKGFYNAFLCTSRRVPVKSAINELYWIWFMRSNKVQELRDLGCKFWNEWEKEDGTIGNAYGYQINTPTMGYKNQLEYIVETLRKDPESRRVMSEIWVPTELDKMALTPCVHLTQWSIHDNKLILEIRIRSNDVALGTLSNIIQYQVLQLLIAKELNIDAGDMIVSIHNAHIYDRHLENLIKQVKSVPLRHGYIILNNSNLYNFKPKDFSIHEYCYYDNDVKYEVAI